MVQQQNDLAEAAGTVVEYSPLVIRKMNRGDNDADQNNETGTAVGENTKKSASYYRIEAISKSRSSAGSALSIARSSLGIFSSDL